MVCCAVNYPTMESITAVLRQNKPVESSIMITDLVLPDGAARGTEVVSTIPIHRD